MTRTRTRYLTDIRQKSGYVTNTGLSFSTITSGFVEQATMVDTLTPGYFNLAKEGLPLPFNNCSRSLTTSREDPMHMYAQDQSGDRKWSLDGHLTQVFSSIWNIAWPTLVLPKFPGLTNLVMEAQAQALGHVDQPRYDFGEPLAELTRTIRDIKRPLHSIKRLVSRFSRDVSLLGRAQQTAERVSDVWANYSFYAGPNIRTINDIVDAYATRNYKRPAYKTARGKASYQSGAVNGSSTGSVSGWISDRVTRRVYTVEVRAFIKYLVNDANSRGELLGLRARDLPGLAWELVPLSFLVDRVLNVSRLVHVGTRFASGNVRIGQSWITIKVIDDNQRTVKGIRRSVPDALNFFSPNTTHPWTVRVETLSRSTWKPSFQSLVKVKPFGLTSGLTQTLDTVSVILSNVAFATRNTR